jgi:hypothetical protein
MSERTDELLEEMLARMVIEKMEQEEKEYFALRQAERDRKVAEIRHMESQGYVQTGGVQGTGYRWIKKDEMAKFD